MLERVGIAVAVVAALFESANWVRSKGEKKRQGTVVRGKKLQMALKFDLDSLEIFHQQRSSGEILSSC